jgi:ComF family protein
MAQTAARATRLSVLSRVGTGLLDLLFPRQCVRCGAMGEFICGPCSDGMILANGERCPVCWSGFNGDRCLRCPHVRPPFAAARSVFVFDSELLPVYEHDGAVRAAVHALKYRGLSSLAPSMAAPMADLLREWSPPVDGIVPVPLFGMRRRVRGYNQAELLGREIGRMVGIPVLTGALIRRTSTPPQVRQVGYDARRANVEGAFKHGKTGVAGRNLLLIDDVMTTGATLAACSSVLLDAGADSVFALTYARED